MIATFLAFLMNASEIIRSIEAEYIKTDLPTIYVGDTVKVGVRIKEGGKERTQPYEGVIIARRGSSVNTVITVRRVFQGIGVERAFLLHSPQIESIKVIRRGKVRRAKLYYLRDLVGKATRLKQRFDRPL
jgi:large subunit ribosomal protein L19